MSVNKVTLVVVLSWTLSRHVTREQSGKDAPDLRTFTTTKNILVTHRDQWVSNRVNFSILNSERRTDFIDPEARYGGIDVDCQTLSL